MPPEADTTSAPLACHAPVRSGLRIYPTTPIPAELLFKGQPEILIAHGDATYRLRITRNHKLILTK